MTSLIWTAASTAPASNDARCEPPAGSPRASRINKDAAAARATEDENAHWAICRRFGILLRRGDSKADDSLTTSRVFTAFILFPARRATLRGGGGGGDSGRRSIGEGGEGGGERVATAECLFAAAAAAAIVGRSAAAGATGDRRTDRLMVGGECRRAERRRRSPCCRRCCRPGQNQFLLCATVAVLASAYPCNLETVARPIRDNCSAPLATGRRRRRQCVSPRLLPVSSVAAQPPRRPRRQSTYVDSISLVDQWHQRLHQNLVTSAIASTSTPASNMMDPLLVDPGAQQMQSMWQSDGGGPGPGGGPQSGPNSVAVVTTVSYGASSNGYVQQQHPGVPYDGYGAHQQPTGAGVVNGRFPQAGAYGQPHQQYMQQSPSYPMTEMTPNGQSTRPQYRQAVAAAVATATATATAVAYDQAAGYGYPEGAGYPPGAYSSRPMLPQQHVPHPQQQIYRGSQVASYPVAPASAQARMPNGMPARMAAQYGAPPEYPGRPGMVQMRPGMPQYPQARPQPNGAMVVNRQPMPAYANGAAPMPAYANPHMVRPGAPYNPAAYPMAPHMNAMDLDGPARFTLPTNLTLLKPFGLNHNDTVTTLEFIIPQNVYQDLHHQSELDVQLKCFHREDRRMENSWPQAQTTSQMSVQVQINGHVVPFRSPHRSLYVKTLCIPGRNVLQITVNQCVCSHFFLMQIVRRVPVRKLAEQMLQSNPLTPNSFAMSKQKVQQYFQSSQQSDVEPTGVRLSLVCPLTRTRINVPARGVNCPHLPCFDLEAFLTCNQERALLECPHCRTHVDLPAIEIDQFVASILQETRSYQSAVEVLVDSFGQWRLVDGARPVPGGGGGIKRELHDSNDFLGAGGPPLKRIKSESLSLGIKSEVGVASPLYMPNSVPPQPTAHWGSPNGGPPSVLSPYSVGANGQIPGSSPNLVVASASALQGGGNLPQQGGPPSAPSRYDGPGTPVTPGTVHNPPSVGLLSGTSPGALGHHVQQQSSVETANSVAGSAPYTPASVGSAGSQYNGQSMNGQTLSGESSGGSSAHQQNSNTSASSDFDFLTVDDILFDTDPSLIMSEVDIQRYLPSDFQPAPTTGKGESDAAPTDSSTSVMLEKDWPTESVLSLLAGSDLTSS
uniref:SP-RING-type domain-containing protein n=1 Tax=Plectus sambesii TaxID=2011161 RepID=A0A914VV58_9BILA